MNRRLVKDLERMYLVLDIEQIDENEYILQMALRGRLPSLLKLSISSTDGKKVLRADVTGCTSIASRYQSIQMTGSDIRKVLMTINDVVQKLPGYLLDPGDLYLDPECIYYGPGADEILLCYVPHLAEEDPDTIRILADFFLKKADHSDKTAADLAYGLYDRVCAEHYTAGDVLERLLREARTTCPWPEKEREPEEKREEAGNIRILPPPENRDRRGRKSGRMKQGRGSAARSRAGGGRVDRKRGGRRGSIKKFLPVIVILLAAVLAIILFHMDLTQIGGMGFLCAALIWLTYSTLEKGRGEIHNVWADEDDPGDDAFYQSLLNQVYAEDMQKEKLRERQQGQSPGRYPHREFPDAGFPENEAVRSGPCLLSLQKDLCPDISLSSSCMILGKSREKADVILPDDTVSRLHARIEKRTDGYYISDLYSTNGTWLDDSRIESGKAVRMKDGSVLEIGSLQFKILLR